MKRIARVAVISALIIAAFATVSLLLPLSAGAQESAPDNVDSVSAVQALVPDSLNLTGKVVYLDFWASWCAPCKKSFPWLRGMLDKYDGSGLQIVTVNLDRDHEAALRFLKEADTPFYVYYDSTGDVAAQFQLEGMPTSLIYGRDGLLRTRHEGFSDSDTLKFETTIRDLLEEKKAK